MNKNKRRAEHDWGGAWSNKRSQREDLGLRDTDMIDSAGRHAVVEARHVDVLHNTVSGVRDGRLEVKSTGGRSDVLVVGHVGRRTLKAVRVVFSEWCEGVCFVNEARMDRVVGDEWVAVKVRRLSEGRKGCRKLVAKVDRGGGIGRCVDKNTVVFTVVNVRAAEGRSCRGGCSLGDWERAIATTAVVLEAHLARAGVLGSRLDLGGLHVEFCSFSTENRFGSCFSCSCWFYFVWSWKIQSGCPAYGFKS